MLWEEQLERNEQNHHKVSNEGEIRTRAWSTGWTKMILVYSWINMAFVAEEIYRFPEVKQSFRWKML